jgi:hypothetical protein
LSFWPSPFSFVSFSSCNCGLTQAHGGREGLKDGAFVLFCFVSVTLSFLFTHYAFSPCRISPVFWSFPFFPSPSWLSVDDVCCHLTWFRMADASFQGLFPLCLTGLIWWKVPVMPPVLYSVPTSAFLAFAPPSPFSRPSVYAIMYIHTCASLCLSIPFPFHLSVAAPAQGRQKGLESSL